VGSATQPIIFKNCGGLVTIGHNTYYAALDFQGCKYFQATGSAIHRSRTVFGWIPAGGLRR